METKPILNKWLFFIKWVLGNTLGMTVAMPIIAMVLVPIFIRFFGMILFAINNPARLTQPQAALSSDELSLLWQRLSLFTMAMTIFVSILSAVLLGVIQWLIVRKYISNAKNWIWASCLGLSLGVLIIIFGSHSLGFNRDLPTLSFAGISAKTGAIIGATLGIAQWVILRKNVRWASLWIPLNIGVCAIATHISWGWPAFIGIEPQEGLWLFFAYGFLLIRVVWMYSISTGVALPWLLSHPKQQLQVEPA